MIDLSINRDSKQAIYHQIAEQLKTQISHGRLPANTRLPTVRQLARDLGVTRLTVQNAYGELQADGWIEATVGRGTFVSSAVQTMSLLPTVGQYLTPDSALSDMLQIDQVVGVRSMAMAHPDPNYFPVDEFWGHLTRLAPTAASLMSYGPLQGDADLRVTLAGMMQEDGITAAPENIMITSGAMQAISLAAQLLAQPGDTVLVEQPTFLGTLNILKAQNLRPFHIPLDEEGPDLDAIEAIARRQRPRFLYTVPNFHNPTGVCMAAGRRRALLTLAERHNFMLVEDDIYGRLAYDETPPPSLKALDENDRVLYLGSFSKSLMPGLRAGWLVTPPRLRTRLLSLRRATDLNSAIFVQRALAGFLRDGGLKRHLKRVLPHYEKRRDTLLTALQTHMPASVKWTHPRGGFCCWVTMPRYFAPGELYRTALQHGFAFTPGEAYLIESNEEEYFRLCFGNLSQQGIESGIKLLAQLIEAQMQGQGQTNHWVPMM